ncbi:D-glycero-alpha-D-manno-heptose-1,7-bisphosphate 7-phosphatase [Caulobacter sp. LjRoot300]|uniref:D-glycero-alpha-D-manno-heptose-1,7-bisphosphate 7-phosphatase n=1 Tax=Caulobacter sp. LjRoot300 TaxID=3342321 RepID=UPI003ECEAB3F
MTIPQTYWRAYARPGDGRPALFLDRDGVLVEEVDYLGQVEDVRLLDGVADLLEHARSHGFAVGVVTNQAGVGRGYYGWADFEAVQAEIARQIGSGDAPFDFIAASGCHPQAVTPELRIDGHPWRKPNPGMLLHAADALGLDLSRSIMAGDHLTDMQAGAAAGVDTLVHLRTGHGRRLRPDVEAFGVGRRDLRLVEDLAELRGLGDWARLAQARPAG